MANHLSQSLVYELATRSAFDALYEPTNLESISILPGSTPTLLKIFQNTSPRDIVWPSSRPEIYFLGSYDPERLVDSTIVNRLSISGSHAQNEIKIFHTGQTEDADALLNIGNGEIAVKVADGLDTRVDILNPDGKTFVLYEAKCLELLAEFDVKQVDDQYVFAGIKSSGPRKEPPNIWIGRAKRDEKVCSRPSVIIEYDD